MNPHALLRQRAVEEMNQLRELHGYVPHGVVAELAEVVGRSERTVWRWLAEDTASAAQGSDREAQQEQERPLGELELEVIVACGGNVAAAHRNLVQAGESVPSERTLRRRWEKADPTLRAYVTGGADALKDVQLYRRYETPERNLMWDIDHQELPVSVVPKGHRTPQKPWLTTVIDDCTRMVMSQILTFGRPGAEEVVAALADGMRLKPTTSGEAVGGVPQAVRCDHAAEFKGRLFRESLLRLGVAVQPTYPYLSHLNGKVERFHRTLQDEFCATLPGYTHGPRTLSKRDLFGSEAEPLHEKLFLELLLDWVERYNTERPHQTLEGRTPLQAWCDHHTPLRQVDVDQLRLSMVISEDDRKVTKSGVRFDRVDYTSPDLPPVGTKVEVRYLPHDRSFIEVFYDGQWACTAWPHANLTDEEVRQLQQRRIDQYTDARAFHRAAAERRQLAAAEATPEQPRILPAAAVVTPADLAPDDEALLELGDESFSDDDAGAADSDRGEGDQPEANIGEVDPWRLARLAAGPRRGDGAVDTDIDADGQGDAPPVTGDLDGWQEYAEFVGFIGSDDLLVDEPDDEATPDDDGE